MIDVQHVQQFMQSDLSPFREIRQMLAQDLQVSIEEVQQIELRNELREIPSPDCEWVHHEQTGKQQITLTLTDEKHLSFTRNLRDNSIQLSSEGGDSH